MHCASAATKYTTASGRGFFTTGHCPAGPGCPPTGSITWAVNLIPAKCMGGPSCPVKTATEGLPFPAPCPDPIPYPKSRRAGAGANPSGLCAGNLPYYMSLVDTLLVAPDTAADEYVLGVCARVPVGCRRDLAGLVDLLRHHYRLIE
jgi:hypothetical protein